MKLAIITSGFLPVPASKGGAVENLIVNLLNENELNKKNPLNIIVYSDYDEIAKQSSKVYTQSNFVFIKTPKIINFLDKALFFVAKNWLKKTNSQSYRFILKRLYYLNKVSKYLKKYNYDKVLLENHPTQFLALKWRKNYRKYEGRYYYHCHNEFPGLYGCEKIIKETKKFICVSNYISKSLQNYLKLSSEKFVVLKNAINQDKFHQNISKERKGLLLRKYKIEHDDKVLLFTGRIVPEKGVLELLNALNYVKGKYKLLIVGASLNSINAKTKYELEVESKVKSIEKKVVFTGYIDYDKIYELYQLADIAVLPSIWDDPAPLTIIESLTCGLPIITTNSGGIPEYVNNKCAIILDKKNNKFEINLAKSIEKLLNDKEKRMAMKAESLKISKNLTTKKYYNNFLNTLSEDFYFNVLFDTSSGSQNMGDYIIVNSVERELSDILSNNFLVKYGTHTPITHFYQNIYRNATIKYLEKAKYKFIAGTNLLNYNMCLPWNNWNVNIFNYRPYKKSILVGVGINPNAKKVNWYTKLLYKKTLSKKYIHSTRDERTKKFLESIGIKAINTGCATMWMLTRDFCKEIPTKKSENVIFTLTDYCPDKENDQKLIDVLQRNYKNVYFWIQGSRDYQYIKSFENIDNIKMVNPNLKSYDNILNMDIDYVGTRLHAGIFAMQHKCRSIIIAVDNRALDIREKYNINCFLRTEIDKIEKVINSEFETKVHIDEEKINAWKSQFKNY